MKHYLRNQRGSILMVEFLVLGIVIAIGGFTYVRVSQANKNAKVDVGAPATHSKKPTMQPPPPIVDSNSTTITQNGVTLKVTPNHGPVGTKVQVTISGIADTNNVTLYFTDSTGGAQAEGVAIKAADIVKGGFIGSITIPTKVLAAPKSGAQEAGPETTAAKGKGSLTLSHGSASDIYVTVPFTVE